MKALICPSCGADLPGLATQCEYCGTSLVPVALTPGQQEALFLLVRQANDRLQSKHSEMSLRLHVLLLAGYCLFLVLLTLADRWAFFDWKQFLTLSVLGGVMVASLRSLWLPSRISREMGKLYRQEIQPQFERFLLEHPMPRWQFENLGRDSLPEKAPLRLFFRPGK